MSDNEKGIKGAEPYHQAIVAAKEGRLDDIDPKMFLVYYNTLIRIRKDYMPVSADLASVCGVWVQGPAGIGKSFVLRKLLGNKFYRKMRNQWWDGYIAQEYVICDDVDVFDVKLGGLIKDWCDSYALTVETKGGAQSIRPKNVFITSQYSIGEIWKDHQTVDAITRRCRVVNLFDATNCPIWHSLASIEELFNKF